MFVGLLMALSGCGGSKFMLDRGQDSYERQDYRQAFLRLEPAAKAGNKEAQYALAYMYYNGQGVIENQQEAFKWMQLAADQGQTDAIKALSMLKPTLRG
jgi:TPR repeat protein